MAICRLEHKWRILLLCVAISLTAFERTPSLERKHTLAKVVLCLVAFPSVELMPARSIEVLVVREWRAKVGGGAGNLGR